MQYTIHQATVNDIEELDRIHAENMKGYVERVYPWNPTLFRESFVPEDYQVIKIEDIVIGCVKIVVSETEIYLAEIQINYHYQNRGIGTSLIRSIIRQARADNKKLWLKVLQGNPAERLYKRLGFIILSESSTHKIMVFN